jgi:hydroxyacylglutathione hydrolase
MHVHVADLPRRLAEIPRDRPIHAYCRSGQRAAIAASLLDGAGYRTVLVDGGFRDWQQRGYPVE